MVKDAQGDISIFASSPLSEREMWAWEKGLRGAQLFQEYFPEEFATSVAPWPITLPRLLLVCEAFLGLVDDHLFEQVWGEMYVPDRLLAQLANPKLTIIDTVIGSIDEIELHHIIPTCFGIGVQSIYNNVYEDTYFEHDIAMLTLCLWSTFERTAWDISIPDAMINALEPSERDYLSRLPRLPRLSEDEIAEGLAQLQITHQGTSITGDHIRYAFGQTDNVMADYTNMELDDIGAGYATWRDTDARLLATDWSEARDLATSYHAWANAVGESPNRHIPTIIEALFTVFAPFGAKLPKPIKPSAKLIDLLTEETDATTLEAIEALATA